MRGKLETEVVEGGLREGGSVP